MLLVAKVAIVMVLGFLVVYTLGAFMTARVQGHEVIRSPISMASRILRLIMGKGFMNYRSPADSDALRAHCSADMIHALVEQCAMAPRGSNVVAFATYINVAKYTERRARAEALLTAMQFPFPVPRLNASTPDTADTQRLIKAALEGTRGRWWTRGEGEVACLASHMRAWARIAQLEDPCSWGLIFEDDLAVNESACTAAQIPQLGGAIVRALGAMPQSVGLIHMCSAFPEVVQTTTTSVAGAVLTLSAALFGARVAEARGAFGCIALAMRPRVARALIARTMAHPGVADGAFDYLFIVEGATMGTWLCMTTPNHQPARTSDGAVMYSSSSHVLGMFVEQSKVKSSIGPLILAPARTANEGM